MTAPATRSQTPASDALDWSVSLAERTRLLQPSAIRAMARHANEPGVISFAAGAPNPQVFPHEAITACISKLLADPTTRTQALQYGTSEGYPPLRAFIAGLIGDADAPVEPEDILITSGSQQALELTAKVLIDKGDRIVTTSPTYVGALQAFNLFEPTMVGVPLDGDTIDLERLEAEFEKGAKFFYVMPDHGNPNGSSLARDQRRPIVELARRYAIPVVEDQAYDQLQLIGEKMPTLLHIDRASASGDPIVIYLGTFSKSLTPGFRVGWIAAPEAVRAKLVPLKQASDLNSSTLSQMVVDGVAREIFESHAPVLQAFYRRQRDAMVAALDRHMPPSVTATRPNGGMFVWLTLPDGMSADDLLKTAFADEKVIFVPGASFHPDGGGTNTLRLSFSMPDPDRIDEGVARLARAIAKMAAS